MLLSVPYALKAADSETLGGLPASAFMLATPLSTANPQAAGNVSPTTVTPAAASVTGSGTAHYLPLWIGATSLGNSVLFQSGSGSSAKLGINTTAPTATLDVKGPVTFHGPLNFPAINTANSSSGSNSQPETLVASVFNGNTQTAVNEKFRWQAEPVNNNQGNASASLNLLFGQGTLTPAETGLKIASNGNITFAHGQTFPGTGPGTITGVAAGTGLLGGGTTGAIMLNIDNTKVPLLNAANTFTQSQTVGGNLSATGVVTGSAYQIGSRLFAFGSNSASNSFLGFAGNTTTTGTTNVGVGSDALYDLTTGFSNTAAGVDSLYFDTTGFRNSGFGTESMNQNTTGFSKTAIGYQALMTNVDGDNNTAIGDSALANLTGHGSNTAVGTGALLPSLDGAANTAVGFEAGYNFHGTFNTFLGYKAGFDLEANLSNATAITSAVLTDLAVGFLPESALQPGMRVISEDKRLPRLRDAQIALMRASHGYGGIYDALATHIVTAMGNLDSMEPLQVAAE